jgi:hypothetical protein
LVVANACGNSPSCSGLGTLAVLLGNGNGTFQTAISYGSGGFAPVSVAVADVNGDSKPDLVVANAGSFVDVLLGNGDGTFQAAVGIGSGGINPYSVAVADVNGDGKPDIIVANAHSKPKSTFGSVGVLMNNSGPHSPTTTALVSNVNPAAINQLVTYTATVTNQSGGPLTGTIKFQHDNRTTTIPLVGSQAMYKVAYGSAGHQFIEATYLGDADNAASASEQLTEYVGLAWTRTILTTSGSPSFVGKPVTFTATVSWNYGAVPDGELVTFYDGVTSIGTGNTASGVAKFTTSSLTVKTHTIKATYAGDANFKISSGTVTQVVEKYPTTTTLSSSPNPSNFGQAVTFTANVTSTGPSAPTGTVRFLDGTTTLGAATLSSGVAKLTKSKLAVGTHPITAHYLGDAVSATSTSSVVNQVVQ